LSGAYIVVGSQWGDEGKGLISSYLSARENALAVYRAGTGANAEHGLFLSDEKTYIKVNQLPLGWMLNPKAEIRIGSGVAVDPVKLFKEIEKYGIKDRIKVDYRCPIITAEHIRAEEASKGMHSIGSTFSGTGYCRADFVLRKASQAINVDLFNPHGFNSYLFDCGRDINKEARKGVVIIESSQGTFLSLAVSQDYPNTTSDNVTAVAAMDDVLLNWKHLKEVVLVVKALPTREGAGKMGDVQELSLAEIVNKNMVEESSIGGVTRRKASSIDLAMLEYAVEINGATQIALTFCDHYDPDARNVTKIKQLPNSVFELIDKIEKVANIPVTILNTGKPYWAIIDMGYPNWDIGLRKKEEYLLTLV
jgi:adenylosuccinate synthase